MYIERAKLWSTEHPELYTLKVSVKEDDDVLDEVTENFGIRTLSADPLRGLLINGEPVLLRGGCIHHDLGPLGAADKAFAEERRIRLLKHEAYEALDVVGLNYMLAAYEPMTKAYPNRVILGTEMTPPSIGKNWKAVKALPAVIGDFTWTAFDYIGEAGVGVVTYNGKNDFQKPYPCYLAYCGDFDITGFRRPLSYYREIVFGLRKAPYLSVQLPEHYEDTPQHTPWALPDSVGSWTWPGFEGKPCRVEVYSNAPETELFINGKSVGKVTTGDEVDCRAVLETIYEPGTIEAVSYFADGSEERFTLCTAADEWLLNAAPEREVFGVNDICYIPIELRDAAGNLNTAAACTVSVEVSGDGVLLGLASADPMSEEDFFEVERKTFYGRALAIVKRTGEGEICVKICAEEQEKDLHL